MRTKAHIYYRLKKAQLSIKSPDKNPHFFTKSSLFELEINRLFLYKYIQDSVHSWTLFLRA